MDGLLSGFVQDVYRIGESNVGRVFLKLFFTKSTNTVFFIIIDV